MNLRRFAFHEGLQFFSEKSGNPGMLGNSMKSHGESKSWQKLRDLSCWRKMCVFPADVNAIILPTWERIAVMSTVDVKKFHLFNSNNNNKTTIYKVQYHG